MHHLGPSLRCVPLQLAARTHPPTHTSAGPADSAIPIPMLQVTSEACPNPTNSQKGHSGNSG